MDKQTLVRQLQKTAGQGMITKTGLAEFFGVAKVDYIEKYVDGLERVSGKYYFIPDVANAILNRRLK